MTLQRGQRLFDGGCVLLTEYFVKVLLKSVDTAGLLLFQNTHLHLPHIADAFSHIGLQRVSTWKLKSLFLLRCVTRGTA